MGTETSSVVGTSSPCHHSSFLPAAVFVSLPFIKKKNLKPNFLFCWAADFLMRGETQYTQPNSLTPYGN